MAILPIESLRDHCRTDGDDDAQLLFYGKAAESAVAAYLDRQVFKDQAEWDAAVAAIPTNISAAMTAYDARILALGEADDIGHAEAYRQLQKARMRQHMVLDGIVANADIEAAMLLLAGNLYRNREGAVVGETAAVLPYGIEMLLAPYRTFGYYA